MTYPQEYIEFLVHFHGSRDYFECHEILEEYWKKIDRNNKSSIWVGLIQLAVSQYHHRRGNFTGAYKTLQKSWQILSSRLHEVKQLGIEEKVLMEELQFLLRKIKEHQGYKSLNLPLSCDLINQCQKRCQELNLIWGNTSIRPDATLVHRHKVRDRSRVIQERNKALQKKQRKEANS